MRMRKRESIPLGSTEDIYQPARIQRPESINVVQEINIWISENTKIIIIIIMKWIMNNELITLSYVLQRVTIHPVFRRLKMKACSLPRQHGIGPRVYVVSAGRWQLEITLLRHPLRHSSWNGFKSLVRRSSVAGFIVDTSMRLTMSVEDESY